MITQIFLVSLKVPRQQPIISTNDVDVAMPPGVGFFNEAGRPSHFSQLHRNPLQPKAWHSKCSSKKMRVKRKPKIYIYIISHSIVHKQLCQINAPNEKLPKEAWPSELTWWNVQLPCLASSKCTPKDARHASLVLCHWVAKNPAKHTPCRRSCPCRALISQSWGKFRLCSSWSKESRNILIMKYHEILGKYWWILTHGGHLEKLIFSKIAIPPPVTPWHPVLLTEVAWRGSLAVVPNSGKWRKSSWNQAGEHSGTYGIQGIQVMISMESTCKLPQHRSLSGFFLLHSPKFWLLKVHLGKWRTL